MDGQLSDVNECMLVGLGQVNGEDLHHGHLHEVDQGDGGGGGELGVLYIRHVHRLQIKSIH